MDTYSIKDITDTYSIKDIIAQAYINIDFPAQYIATMHNKHLSNVGISDFYLAFCKKNSIDIQEGKNVLFQPALILGFLYVSFLLPQQSFFDKIPKTSINLDEWGINRIKGKENNSLQYIARRMRNALSHNNFIVTKNMDFIFWDAKPRKGFSEADVIYYFNFEGLMFKFIKKWNDEIKKYLNS